MSSLLMLLAALLTTTPAGMAQVPPGTAAYATADASISDPGELYSTYDLTADTAARAAIQTQTSAALLQDILIYSNERSWPSGIATLDGRIARREQIQDYRVYAIARFNDKVVLRVPAAENQHMPADMRPSRDIYLIFGQGGVSVGAPATPATPPAPAPATPAEVRQFSAIISDPGELYSTYNLSSEATTLASIQAQTSAALLQDILIYSNERSWPSEIATLDGRIARREQIRSYRVYVIARFNDKVVLRVPADENQHMPAGMRPARDIYFIFGQGGIQASSAAPPAAAASSGGLGFGSRPAASVAPTPAPTVAPTVAPTPARSAPTLVTAQSVSAFSDALALLVAAFPKNFESLRGAAMEEAGSYTSRQSLPGAQKTYVYQDMMARANRLHASYGSWRIEAEGRKAYQDLVAKVTNSTLACCTLVASEKVETNGAYTSWIPLNPPGEYQGMVIEVQLTKMPGLDENMKLIEEWSLMLRIYRL